MTYGEIFAGVSGIGRGAGFIVGIDPGITGAIAVIDADTQLMDIWDMPTIGKDISPHHTCQLFARIAEDCLGDVVAVIEQVASRPGQSAPATFRFGRGYGVVETAVAAANIPVTYVTPARWKRDMRLTADKGLSRRRACQQWPQQAARFARVKDDGRAEAALLAVWHHNNRRTP